MTFLYIGMDIGYSKNNLHVRKCSGYYKITVTVLAGWGGKSDSCRGGQVGVSHCTIHN